MYTWTVHHGESNSVAYVCNTDKENEEVWEVVDSFSFQTDGPGYVSLAHNLCAKLNGQTLDNAKAKES